MRILRNTANIVHTVFASDKKTATKIFSDYIRAAWRAEEKRRQKQEGKKNVN